MTLLPKIEECWKTVTPNDHWHDWLNRDEQFTEIELVKRLIGWSANRVIIDIGCGSGRYAHQLNYSSYIGIDPWRETIDYAREWASKNGLKNAEFRVGSALDPIDPSAGVVLSLNVMRHWIDPWVGYNSIWNYLPKGCIWITDFLTHGEDKISYDGDISSIVPFSDAVKFAESRDIKFETVFWLHEVGDWWLFKMTK